jgi:hypothetical protein
LTFFNDIVQAHQSIHICHPSAFTLTKENDAVWTSTKVDNVVVNPVDGSANVQEPKVLSQSSETCKLWCIRLAKDVDPIIKPDNS